GGLPAGVLAPRESVIEERNERPSSEVNRRPDQEERHVEKRRLPAKQRIVFGGARDGPRVDILQAEEQRNEEGGHHRDRRENGLAGPAHHDPPSSLARIHEQGEAERAEGQTQKEQERHEPREEELLRIRRPQKRAGRGAQHGPGGANDWKTVPRRP